MWALLPTTLTAGVAIFENLKTENLVLLPSELPLDVVELRSALEELHISSPESKEMMLDSAVSQAQYWYTHGL
jgi:hypothetical protein